MIKITYNPQRDAIIVKLKDIFRNHVGINNPISTESLYKQLTGIHPSDVDRWEFIGKWAAIRRILSALRKSGDLFVVMGISHHYVLNDKDELYSYKNKVDATIKGLHNIKKKAEHWVSSKELKELKKKKKKKDNKKILVKKKKIKVTA